MVVSNVAQESLVAAANALQKGGEENLAPLVSDEEVYLEKLDFGYLGKCTNADEIATCIEILLLVPSSN